MSEEKWDMVQLRQHHSASYFLLNIIIINFEGAIRALQSSKTFIGLETKEWCAVINTDEKIHCQSGANNKFTSQSRLDWP